MCRMRIVGDIGAASPVDSSGADITGTLGLKVMNDAVANISAIAQARGRPVAWAASTVSAAKSYSAADAVAAGAADGIAATEADVLAAANGKTVGVAGGASITLALGGVTTEVDPGLEAQWRGFALQDELRKATGRDVRIVNDATLA